jgi:hypothetical protein
MNKIKTGFLSLTELPEAANYVEWHPMDHMPEQFRVRGLSWGQRFVATSTYASPRIQLHSDAVAYRLRRCG